MAPDLIVGQWYPTGTFVESYRGYDLYIKSGGFFETGNVAVDAVIEIRPVFDDWTFEYRTYARQHIDEHCNITGTCPPIATCQLLSSLLSIPSSVQQGTLTPLTITPSGGIPPYRYDLLVDNTIKSTWTGMTGPQTFNWGFNESVGTHSYAAKITDSCTYPGGPSISSDVHNVAVTEPPSPTLTYSCINNVCTLSPCTQGTPNCYTTSNCNNLCACPSGQMNILGNCVSTTYVIAGGAGLLLLMLLKK